MANMSYCRFQNTLMDLRDCSNELENMSDDLDIIKADLSKDEFGAFLALVRECQEITERFTENDDLEDLIY